MKIKLMTKDGTHEKTLTKKERKDLADKGHPEAKKEILIEEMKTTSSIQEELDAIKKYLGV